MNEWQLLAAAIAVALVILIVLAAFRWRLSSVTVMFLLLFGLPAFGFAVYAVQPGPRRTSKPLWRSPSSCTPPVWSS